MHGDAFSLAEIAPANRQQNSLTYAKQVDCRPLVNVRFAPNSGHVQCNSVCPLCANSGHRNELIRYSITSSARLWTDRGTVMPSALSGLEVDDKLDFGCLLDGQVGGFLAIENSPSVDACLAYRASR